MSDTMTIREHLIADFDIDFPISGGMGKSKDDAIILQRQHPNDYVGMEYAILGCFGKARKIIWEKAGQALLNYKGRKIDLITIRIMRLNGTEFTYSGEEYFFDITECM